MRRCRRFDVREVLHTEVAVIDHLSSIQSVYDEKELHDNHYLAGVRTRSARDVRGGEWRKSYVGRIFDDRIRGVEEVNINIVGVVHPKLYGRIMFRTGQRIIRRAVLPDDNRPRGRTRSSCGEARFLQRLG